jgi:hypothetical protein
MPAERSLKDARKLALLRELVKNPHKHWELRELKRPCMPSTSLRELVLGLAKKGFVSVEPGSPMPRNPKPLGVRITIAGIDELDRMLREEE